MGRRRLDYRQVQHRSGKNSMIALSASSPGKPRRFMVSAVRIPRIAPISST
jgi:hypothetical protein